jgi:hypothetical protein
MAPSTTGTSNEAISYFGFGAMVNPTSRSRRGVVTVRERPAILKDFELSFSLTGAGTINPAQGQEVHGVLMEFQDEEHWKIIQGFEKGYDVLKGPVYPYGSQDEPIQAHYFQIPPSNIQENTAPRKPQERYLKVIASGMVHHGVDPEYVQRNIKSVDCIPARQPHEYLHFPLSEAEEELPLLTWEEYTARITTVNPCFLIGEKVIEVVNPDPPALFESLLKERLLGKKCCAFGIYQLLYDPDLPVCPEEGDLQDLHLKWAENQLFDFFQISGMQARTIGKLSRKE